MFIIRVGTYSVCVRIYMYMYNNDVITCKYVCIKMSLACGPRHVYVRTGMYITSDMGYRVISFHSPAPGYSIQHTIYRPRNVWETADVSGND